MSDEQAEVGVRSLVESDLDAIVKIDELAMGAARPEFYRERTATACREPMVYPTFVATCGGTVVGFLMATVQRGEFGRPETTIVVDAVGVHRDYRRKKVARSLMNRLLYEARELKAASLRTEVAWNDFDLVRFFNSEGFAPAWRIVLERTP